MYARTWGSLRNTRIMMPIVMFTMSQLMMLTIPIMAVVFTVRYSGQGLAPSSLEPFTIAMIPKTNP